MSQTTLKTEQEDVKQFFHGYAQDFDSIYGHSGKRSLFDKIADKLFRGSMYSRYNETLKNTQHENIKTVLDVGCGGGHYTEALLKQGKIVTGIDIAEGMLKIAAEKTKEYVANGKVNYIYNGYLEQTFPTQFDAAVLTGFFDYIKYPEEVFRKLQIDIKKEVYMSFPKKEGILAYQRKIRYAQRNCPLYLYSRQSLVGMLKNVGWENKATITDLGRDYFVKVRLG